jgi:hypothetical protein
MFCSWHRNGITAVFTGEDRRQTLARWARELPMEGTVKLMPHTHLHKALIESYVGNNRFVDVRDNDQNAGGLQKALILGFLRRDKEGTHIRYMLTDVGYQAMTILNVADNLKNPRHYVDVPYKKNSEWAEHAQTKCW